MTKIDTLKQQVQDLGIKHYEIYPNIYQNGYCSLTIHTVNDGIRNFWLDESCATTLRNMTGTQTYERDSEGNIVKINRVYEYSHKQIKQAIREFNRETIHNALQCFDKDKTYDIVCYSNNIVGFFNNYNFVDPLDIVDRVVELGLSEYIESYEVSHTDLKINIMIQKISDNSSYALQIYNNLNSFKGLGYQVVFKYGDNYYNLDTDSDTKRHLSNVDKVANNIIDYMVNLRDVKYHNTLWNTRAGIAMRELKEYYYNLPRTTDKQKEVLDVMEYWCLSKRGNLPPSNAYDFIKRLSVYSDKHGYKTFVNNAIEYILKELLD